MTNCQVNNFECADEDLCGRCGGTGNEPQEELCCSCGKCFDEEIGWSTGIEPNSPSQKAAREFIKKKRMEIDSP